MNIPYKNWLKVLLFFGLILICFSISYYFFLVAPKIKTQQRELENQIKCYKEGLQQYEREEREAEKNIYFDLYYYHDPEFKFNKELNTCLYKVENFAQIKNIRVEEKVIKDLYSNQEIFKWKKMLKNGKWEDVIGTKEEWEERYKNLFQD